MHQGAWQVALDVLRGLESCSGGATGLVLTWIARCQLQLGLYPQARGTALRAIAVLDEHARSAPYARLLLARALRKNRQLETATQLLAQWITEYPGNPQFRWLFADYVSRATGDWPLAQRTVQSLRDEPGFTAELDWLGIRSRLYNGSGSPDQLTADIRRFASQRLGHGRDVPSAHLGSSDRAAVARRTPSARPRLGLVCGLLNASPVYFLCMGALKHLAGEFDLVFFSRGPSAGWAAEAFQSLATEWHEVEGATADALAQRMRERDLHAAIDMCGWMDLVVLDAFTKRPVSRQYKWVGGQFATTGTSAFDGFVSDRYQIPSTGAHLYSEPLAIMPGGYVTYTPPPYMPEPLPQIAGVRPAVGVVAHPIKVSVPFLRYLADQIDLHNASDGVPLTLRFVGSLYAQVPLQRRINTALRLNGGQQRGAVTVEYRVTTGHVEQLRAIAELDWVIDTFPFTGGVTALEALALGVPIRTHAGAHFSARHAYSHARFAGLDDYQINLQRLGALGRSGPVRNGRSLLPEDCPRKQHERLARDLARLFHAAPANALNAMS